MKRCSVLLILFSLLLSGCYLEYRFDDDTPKAIKNIPYFFHVVLDYEGSSDYEYYETEAPYYDNFNWVGSSYDKPRFRYFPGDTLGRERKYFPEHIQFYWVLGGSKDNHNNPLDEICLTALTTQIESGRMYNGNLPDSLEFQSDAFNVCLLKNSMQDFSKCNFSFTRVNDDDTIEYTLQLFASDSLRQPQRIQIDFSKKMMAIRGVAQNFKDYIY